jgi:signal transduction histidine kinase/DNA-binding NarL/FixJ family response regulator
MDKHRATIPVAILTTDPVVGNALRSHFEQIASFGIGCSAALLADASLVLVQIDSKGVPLFGDSTPRVDATVVGVLSRRVHAGGEYLTVSEGLVSDRKSFQMDGWVFEDDVTSFTLLPWVKLALLRCARQDSSSKSQATEMDPAVQYLARSAHELRVPLTSMLSHAETLRDQSLDYAGQLRIVDDITANGRHLLELIDQVLLFSRIRVGELDLSPVDLDLVAFCKEVSPILEARAIDRGNYFSIEYTFPLPSTVVIDDLRLRQVLLNLVGNAIKFTEQGSVSLVVSFDAKHNCLCFDVVDTGRGIPPEALERLFQPFSQGGRSVEGVFGGTGLGLTVSKAIAEALGGEIAVSSVVGHGSVFSLTVPLDPSLMGVFLTAPPYDLKRCNTEVPSVRLKGRVLIADDIAASREFLQLVLTAAGAEVVVVHDGAQALEVGLTNSFDLILMDVEMPGLTGYETIVRLRQRGIAVPIVAITAHLHREDLHRCLEAGANQFVSKGATKQEIVSSLARFVGDSDVSDDGIRADVVETVGDNPRIARAVLKYLTRFDRSLKPIREAAQRREWRQVGALIHSLTPGKMFGFGVITDAVRDIAATIRTIAQGEDDLIAKVQYLEMLAAKLCEERVALEEFCWKREEDLRDPDGTK